MNRLALAALLAGMILPRPTAAAAGEPVRIIFDSDFNTDCDDLAALAILHALADNGEAEILATLASSRFPWSPAAMDVVNTYYGRPDIPTGAPKTGFAGTSKFAEKLARRFPRDTGTADTVPDALEVYRRILAAKPDGSVVIVTVGYLTNIAGLMKTPPDAHSPLNGMELIRRKVARWVCMGGNFHSDSRDNVNFKRDAPSAVHAINHWPVNVTFATREVGSVPSPLRMGGQLAEAPESNPVRAGYEYYFDGTAKDRHCADPAAVLYAVRGLRDYWDIETRGHVRFLNDEADFVWDRSADRDQDYLVPKGGPSVYANRKEITDVLAGLLMQPPKAAGKRK